MACTGGEKISMEVRDLREKDLPEINSSIHKSGDVEVFRSNYLGDTYSIIVYSDVEGELNGYQSYITASQNFDEVTYQWKDDAMVQFILYSSENGQVEKYTLTIDNSSAELEKYN